MKNARRFTALAIVMLALTPVRATATEGVSPGEVDRVATIEQRCPTFSWGENDNAAAYELVAYWLPESEQEAAELSSENEVLFASVAGAATSWTPSAEQCFAPGGRYVWFVRAVNDLIDDQVIEVGDWSAGRYFQVPAGPSADELERALEVLKRWEAVNSGGEGSPSLAGMRSGGASPTLRRSSNGSARADAGTSHRKGEGEGEGHRKSVQTVSAAIRGEHPDTSGEVHGVVGTSASADGAGVAAANLDGGPDLVLDGSADGMPDLVLSESKMIMDASGDFFYEVKNTGEGSLGLDVQGMVEAASVSAGRLEINGTTVIDDTGEWIGTGDMLPCPGCVGSSDIADGAVTGTKIANGAVGSNGLRSNAVTNVHMADDAVTGAEIADGQVSHRELAIDSVRSSHIRNGDVGTAELANGAVTMAKLAPESVGTHHIEYGGVEMDDIASNAVGTDEIVTGGVETSDVLDGTLTAADMDPMGGVYASKSAVYVVTVTQPNSPWACQVASAACADANDLPLFGVFDADIPDYRLAREELSGWDSFAGPAQYLVEVCDQTGTSGSFGALIVCVSVPGS